MHYSISCKTTIIAIIAHAMSSFLGHALIGIAIAGHNSNWNSSNSSTSPNSVHWLAEAGNRLVAGTFCAFLAISPDLDYVLLYLSGYGASPRLTHSLGYCLVFSSLALLLIKSDIIPQLQGISKTALYLIPLSHLLLDYLTGVHQNPFFWPLTSHIFTSPQASCPVRAKLP